MLPFSSPVPIPRSLTCSNKKLAVGSTSYTELMYNSNKDVRQITTIDTPKVGSDCMAMAAKLLGSAIDMNNYIQGILTGFTPTANGTSTSNVSFYNRKEDTARQRFFYILQEELSEQAKEMKFSFKSWDLTVTWTKSLALCSALKSRTKKHLELSNPNLRLAPVAFST